MVVIYEENKALTKIMLECIKDFERMNIDFSAMRDKDFRLIKHVYMINTRCAVGKCHRDVFVKTMQIFFSRKYLYFNERERRNVIMHELIHTLTGCFDHGANFKKVMRYINSKKEFGYHIVIRKMISEPVEMPKKTKNTSKSTFCVKPQINTLGLFIAISQQCMTKTKKMKITSLAKFVRELIEKSEFDYIKPIAKVFPNDFEKCKKYLGKHELRLLSLSMAKAS